MKEKLKNYWNDVANQRENKIRSYFSSDAIINWYNTNESFSLEEFIRANCEYPGKWKADLERIEKTDNDCYITVTRVYSIIDNSSHHAISFFKFKNDKIINLNEYWGLDDEIPQWRIEKKIGKKIS